MNSTPHVSDETRALRALTTFCVLDSLPDERFDRITRLACAALNVSLAIVTLSDRERLWLKSAQGSAQPDLESLLELSRFAVAADEPIVYRDVACEPHLEGHPLVVGPPHIRFYAAKGIRGPDDSHIGALCVMDSRPQPFPPHDEDVLADLAALVAREILLLEHATTDELTRLSNRRGFTQVAHHVLSLCRRTGQPAVVVTVDLDNFKAVNDEHGHAAGDLVLREFSKMLFSNIRNSDAVARVGGDEFAVLLSGTTTTEAVVALDRLTREFAASRLPRDYPTLNWSAGVADFDPRSEATIETLLQAADARMYRAKSAKRTEHAATGGRSASVDQTETIAQRVRRIRW